MHFMLYHFWQNDHYLMARVTHVSCVLTWDKAIVTLFQNNLFMKRKNGLQSLCPEHKNLYGLKGTSGQ